MPKLIGDKTKCVRQCPADTFQQRDKCVKCQPECYQFGCTGNGTNVGPGGCNRCLFAVESLDSSEQTCLAGDQEETVCTNNGYSNYHLTLASAKNKNTKFVSEIRDNLLRFFSFQDYCILILQRNYCSAGLDRPFEKKNVKILYSF